YCALIKEPAAYPELAKRITGYAEQFLQSTSMFILMEVGLTRAVAIYSPRRFKQIFSLGVISIFLGMAPIYGLAVVHLLDEAMGFFLPQFFVYCQMVYPEKEHLHHPMVVLGLRSGPVFMAGVFYVIAGWKLLVRKMTKKVSPSGSPPDAVATSAEVEAARIVRERAQNDMLTLAMVLFVLYLPRFALGPLVSSRPTNFFLQCLHVSVIIFSTGINPILYILMSPTVQTAVSIPVGTVCGAPAVADEPNPVGNII
ncbi:MAG: G-protein coupled receptor, partial [Gammaproteobacteria bacterium]|nr:G-protein coupled receptor [Gammaproteobacteria bacterium]